MFLLDGASVASSCNVDSGQETFNQLCVACHAVIPGNLDKSGPNLYGVFGRSAGSLDSYVPNYSDDMRDSEIVWTAETLDRFLERPGKYIKNTTMIFIGVRRELERRNVICYLETVAR